MPMRRAVMSAVVALVGVWPAFGQNVKHIQSSTPGGIATAVWAGDENRILFYNSSGERVAVVRLSEAPDPRGLAA